MMMMMMIYIIELFAQLNNLGYFYTYQYNAYTYTYIMHE